MPQSLISSLTATLNTGGANRVATITGASEEQVLNGFPITVAAMLGGIVKKVDDPNGLRQVFELLAHGTDAPLGSSSGLHPNTSSTELSSPPEEESQRLLATIFGPDQSSIIQSISNQSDLPSDVVVQMMSVAAPIVLSFLERRVKDQQVSFSAFSALLVREADDVSSHLRASVHNLLRTAEPTLESPRVGGASARKEQSPKARRILTLGLIASLLLGTIWLVRQLYFNHMASVEKAQSLSRAQARFPGFGRFVERELPGEVRLIVPENGMESKVISYIQGSPRDVGEEPWFDFDRLTFATNSAIPNPESEEQLKNLASILKAYSQVRLKVGGYTDNKGDREANQRLSENRAEAVRRELVGLGIPYSRVEAEGYGDQHAIADNSTEGGHAKNRRIALKVLQK